MSNKKIKKTIKQKVFDTYKGLDPVKVIKMEGQPSYMKILASQYNKENNADIRIIEVAGMAYAYNCDLSNCVSINESNDSISLIRGHIDQALNIFHKYIWNGEERDFDKAKELMDLASDLKIIKQKIKK